MLETVAVTGAVVVSSYRLHTLTNTYDYEYQEITICIADTIGANRVVTAIKQQLAVQDGDHTGGG